MQNVLKLEKNSLNLEKNERNLNKSFKSNKFVLIDASAYNVESVVSVMFGYGVYLFFSSIDMGLEGMITVNAFKYLVRL